MRLSSSAPYTCPFQFTHPGRGATYSISSVARRKACFNSRTPGGVRPFRDRRSYIFCKFQFTHPGRGATDHLAYNLHGTHVSIHAPREGCDFVLLLLVRRGGGFNSRTPGGVRPASRLDSPIVHPFQFTHPGRGATEIYRSDSGDGKVSIHAPREGCDWAVIATVVLLDSFNSRTPGGVRRLSPADRGGAQEVSIHAPREGCDTGLIAR